MEERNNYEEELFCLEVPKNENLKKKRSKKLIKSVEKNLTKIFFDQLNGKTGEC